MKNKIIIPTELTPLTLLMRENFPKERFQSTILKIAGKILKKDGKDKAIEYLKGKGSLKLNDFQPPVKCNIIAKSRDFSEWPIAIASNEIQNYTFGLDKNTFDNIFNVELTRKEDHDLWFSKTKISCDFSIVQGLNLIFEHSKNKFNGVIKKVENYNDKKREKFGPDFELKKALTEDLFLIDPPGINACIFGYQGIAPKPCKNIKLFDNIDIIYRDYNHGPNDIINYFNKNRLDIKKGEPGHVPEFQKISLNNSKNYRQRKWYSKSLNKNHITGNGVSRKNANVRDINKANAKDALLAQIRIGDDWCIFDIRGLLRDLKRRGLLESKNVTIQNLLDFFTSGYVVDTKKNIITLVYKPGIVQVHSERIIRGKKSKQVLDELTKTNDVAIVSVDLGQNNPVAYKISKLTNKSGQIISNEVLKSKLSDNCLNEIKQYRQASDDFNKNILNSAILLLSTEEQNEINEIKSLSSEDVKNKLCNDFNLNINDLQWNEMTSSSKFIANLFIKNGGDENLVSIKTKSGMILKSDYKIYKSFISYSEKTRKNLNEKEWGLRRSSNEYVKLSQRKKEFSRKVVNNIEKQAKNETGCDQVIFNIENLNVDNRIFSGSGKRDVGWIYFNKPKSENKWFIQSFHKAFSDLAQNRGSIIIESNPRYTSQTCPQCKYCDSNNRDGEYFKCLKCNIILNADLDVATENLENVAMTGISLPGPKFASGSAPYPLAKHKKGRKNRVGLNEKQFEVEVATAQNLSNIESLAKHPLNT